MARNKGTKLDLWLRAYLNDDNPTTFLNKTASAIEAGYNATSQASFRVIGCANFKRKEKEIERWMDDVGMSDNQLKAKLLSLMDARMTKFFQYQGEVMDEKEVEALDIQLKATDMAIKVKGLYAAEKRELTGKDGAPIVVRTAVPEPKMLPDHLKQVTHEPDSERTDT